MDLVVNLQNTCRKVRGMWEVGYVSESSWEQNYVLFTAVSPGSS